MFFRFIISAVLGACFLGWAAYRAFVKKDFADHKNEFFFGLFFLGAWAVLFWAMS